MTPALRAALLGAVLLLTGCAAVSTAADCEPIGGVRSGVCPIPIEERVAAPDHALPAVAADDTVDEVALAEFEGRVVVLNFWASWCGPCRVEQPDLNEAHASVPSDEVAFLGVNIEDSEANARAHLREFDVPYPSIYDPSNRYASEFDGVGPRSIPSTVFVDAEGRVAARIFGVVGTTEVLGLVDAIAAEAS